MLNRSIRPSFYMAFSLLIVSMLIPLTSLAELQGNKTTILVDDIDILELSDDIKKLLDREVKRLPNKRQRLTRLHELLYSPENYHIRYNAVNTLSATDTFEYGQGNCISLANLFIASARYVGIKAYYQKVELQEQWHKRDGFFEIPGHINVLLYITRSKKVTVEFNSAFFEEIENRDVETYVISDEQAKAEFYNNLGVEQLNRKQPNKAIAYFNKALSIYSQSDFIWSNLGVAYRHIKDTPRAEQAYLQALTLNPDNKSAIGNIYILYSDIGNKEQADIYAKRAEKHARKNPYYLAKLAIEHITNKEYSAAEKLLKRAVTMYNQEPDFYHQLAVAYYFQNKHTKSYRALKRSKSLAESEQSKQTYQRKLDALASISLNRQK